MSTRSTSMALLSCASLGLFGLFSPVVLLARDANVKTTLWELGTLVEGATYNTQVNVANVSCQGEHTFEVIIENAPWLKLTGPAVLSGIGIGATRTTGGLVDLRGLAPGNYEGLVAIRCLTCPPPPRCIQGVSNLRVTVKIVPRGAGKQEAGSGPGVTTPPGTAEFGVTRKTQVGECGACTTTSECEIPLTCITGRCVGTFGKPLGADCCVNAQCASTSCSSAGHCQCYLDSQCPAGQFCDGGGSGNKCHDVAPLENLCQPRKAECECCNRNFECGPVPANMQCSPDNKCIVWQPKDIGEECCSLYQCKSGICCGGKCAASNSVEVDNPCCADAQCKSGRCRGDKYIDGVLVFGTCVCRKDGDCKADQFCDTGLILGIGRNRCRAKKQECAGCSSSHQCAGGALCKLFKCATGNSVGMGSSCCRDYQCTTGSCSSSGSCQCTQDSQCSQGQYCAKGFLGLGKNQCVAFKAECEECTLSSQCGPGGLCKLGKCVTGNSVGMGGSCCRDYQCTTGSCSSSGICQCTESSQCPQAQYCAEGFLGIGKNQCVSFKAECESCTADKQCAPGAQCVFGFGGFACASQLGYGKGADCCRGRQCASGFCRPLNRTCSKP